MVLILNISPLEGDLLFTSKDTKLKIGDVMVGNGTVYISPDTFYWQPDNKPEGIVVCWREVSVHGISTEPTKCIYFMLDHQITWGGVYNGSNRHRVQANGNGHAEQLDVVDVGVPMDGDNNEPIGGDVDEGNETDEEDGSDIAEEQFTECWLIPNNINDVDTIFQAMSVCQSLHPEPGDASPSDESDFMDDDGVDKDDNLDPNGPGTGDGGNNDDVDTDAAQGGLQNLSLNDDRFADADE